MYRKNLHQAPRLLPLLPGRAAAAGFLLATAPARGWLCSGCDRAPQAARGAAAGLRCQNPLAVLPPTPDARAGGSAELLVCAGQAGVPRCSSSGNQRSLMPGWGCPPPPPRKTQGPSAAWPEPWLRRTQCSLHPARWLPYDKDPVVEGRGNVCSPTPVCSGWWLGRAGVPSGGGPRVWGAAAWGVRVELAAAACVCVSVRVCVSGWPQALQPRFTPALWGVPPVPGPRGATRPPCSPRPGVRCGQEEERSGSTSPTASHRAVLPAHAARPQPHRTHPGAGNAIATQHSQSSASPPRSRRDGLSLRRQRSLPRARRSAQRDAGWRPGRGEGQRCRLLRWRRRGERGSRRQPPPCSKPARRSCGRLTSTHGLYWCKR